MHILILDDSRDNADTLAELLRLLGHEAAAVYDGQTALRLAKEVHPDVVLLELRLAGMSGYEVARRLRRHAIVVAYTTQGDHNAQRAARQAGCMAHLLKPVSISDLEAVLDWVRRELESSLAAASLS